MKIAIVLHTDDGVHFGVIVPDVAGCFSAGDSFDDALSNVQEALAFHFESMLIDGDELPCLNSIEHHKKNPDYQDGVWAYVDFEILKTRRRPNQRVITPDREKSILDAVKISAENGRIRAFNSILPI